MVYGSANGQGSELRVRGGAQVPDEVREYARAKVEAVTEAFGLAPVSGEVRISRTAPAGDNRTWAAMAEIGLPGGTVICHARAATGHEMADLLQDRLRRLVEKEVHGYREGRGFTTAPPWRTARSAGRGTRTGTDER